VSERIARRLHISGIVQGVGFRPFVYGLANRGGLGGFVRNTSSGVEVVLEGEATAVEGFLGRLKTDLPARAHIENLAVESVPAAGRHGFVILESQAQPAGVQPVPPDIALCADCERELFDPADRRYLYPFINCTNCGPRFTIIRGLPYDRPLTSMAQFEMCPACAQEYRDPGNRRFHAQPIACPDCGPQVWMSDSRGNESGRGLAALLEARRMLRRGSILAIRGLGGFHLACDGRNAGAVAELRRRKGRVDKPFAMMAADQHVAAALCSVDALSLELLTGHEKPIVILPKRPEASIAESVAPGLDRLGLMLPYSPLHRMLLDHADSRLGVEAVPDVLVMTSGNLSEEPIATANDEALERLGALADAFLLHNRDIDQRCDDSVVLMAPPLEFEEAPKRFFTRRARGAAPYPVRLPFDSPPTLALGGELKNAFCLMRERSAFLSQHIGDMENLQTLESFEHTLALLRPLFRVEAEIVAHDMHPDYLTTRWANDHRSEPHKTVAVQHHHAHICSCMVENMIAPGERVIGLAFDGTGYGSDGAIWGGEILLASYARFERVAHFEYLPLAGGDAAIREPWKTLVGYGEALDVNLQGARGLARIAPAARATIQQMVRRKVNAPLTSSLGRLFDAAAVIAGAHAFAGYEAQAAIQFEAAARTARGDARRYPVGIAQRDGYRAIEVRELLQAMLMDVRAGAGEGEVSLRFHQSLAAALGELLRQLSDETGVRSVALSGGVWQNTLLLEFVVREIIRFGLRPLLHRQVPPNDGGLALGQAAAAVHRAGG
jgi:hydrogenase maturation protein HypF